MVPNEIGVLTLVVLDIAKVSLAASNFFYLLIGKGCGAEVRVNAYMIGVAGFDCYVS